MKRSEINRAYREATAYFAQHFWSVPPEAKWDITDFGLSDFQHCGLALVNLAAEPEYCEKLMYAKKAQLTPPHTHRKKKEDIICRVGELVVQCWAGAPHSLDERGTVMRLAINGVVREIRAGETVSLSSGYRITLNPGTWHAFYPSSAECIIGEVSTANDDLHDNIFADRRVGRFTTVEEDEVPLVRLVSELNA